MIALVDPQTFAQNLVLIVGAVFLLMILFTAAFALWTLSRALWWYWRQRRSLRAFWLSMRPPDGKPMPPAIEGTCHACEQWFRRVFVLADGEQLCAACYQKSASRAGKPAPTATASHGDERSPPRSHPSTPQGSGKGELPTPDG